MRLPSRLVAFLVVLVHFGCAGGGFRVGVETHSTHFVPIASPRETLIARPAACLVLPASAPDRFTPLTSVSFSMALRDRLPESSAVPASHVATIANAHGLVPAVNAMLAAHATAGLLDVTTLARLGETFGVEYALLPVLILTDRNEQSRLGFLGVNLIFSSWTRVQVAVQLWRTADGALVWQSVGAASIDTETPAGIPVSMQETLIQAFRTMIDDLLLDRSGSLIIAKVPEPKAAVTTEP